VLTAAGDAVTEHIATVATSRHPVPGSISTLLGCVAPIVEDSIRTLWALQLHMHGDAAMVCCPDQPRLLDMMHSACVPAVSCVKRQWHAMQHLDGCVLKRCCRRYNAWRRCTLLPQVVLSCKAAFESAPTVTL
jgi:hypothetical protein